ERAVGHTGLHLLVVRHGLEVGVGFALLQRESLDGVTPPGAGRIGETGGERLVSGLPRPSQQPVPADAERFGRDAEVDEERLSYDVRSRQESPVTTVVGLVPVVA